MQDDFAPLSLDSQLVDEFEAAPFVSNTTSSCSSYLNSPLVDESCGQTMANLHRLLQSQDEDRDVALPCPSRDKQLRALRHCIELLTRPEKPEIYGATGELIQL
ncbi:hypothetical protein GUITHDRAFT_113903 [Guillardia theta CCMP2712]|uniref:Uncharacterized protein n=1 Tax=Guillardia theta (strain CCMP2712) TaxID=905079 RepID=L1IVJ3_GUITC|nr:hypothetical protein GUITHDRAFT_113903 [Guillardia theta CCMP2712]EKX39909.1 hypothetical protein GUITHDRAFT_113903 [Guillardia theta CCMP2712]|eukprot:XP_005826889.1 hypothetical protein GUITHDRAFT_113903 [Guillardia theta CCMP2712]